MAKFRSYIQAIERKGKKGCRVTLFQRLYYNKEQWQTALGISVPAECYDKATGVVSGEDATRFNNIIQLSLQTMNSIMVRYELVERRSPSMTEVTEEYMQTMKGYGLLGAKVADQAKSYAYEYIDEFTQEQSVKRQWSESTVKKFNTLKNQLRTMKKPLRFADVNDDTLMTFIVSLQKDHGNPYLQKHTKQLRWFLRWAYRKGYYKGTSHDTFRPVFKGGNYDEHNIIYLTKDELKTFETYQFGVGEAHLERVRDIFVFACYCGMRFSDVKKLRTIHIVDDKIAVIPKKTIGRIEINLNKHTKAILEKYKEWSASSGFALPVPSNQKTNAYLHEGLKRAGIDTPTSQIYFSGDKMTEVVLPKYELATFHASRRTFITQGLTLGIPAEVIMKFSGHKRREMLKPYLAIVDELKKQEMAKFDDF